MAEIPTTLDTSNVTPIMQDNPVDVGAIDQQYNENIGEYQNSINNQLNRYQNVAYQAEKAQLIAQESEHQKEMNLPLVYGKLQMAEVAHLGRQADIDIKEKQKDQSQIDAAWLYNKVATTNENFLQFQDQAKNNMAPDGQGYSSSILNFIHSAETDGKDTAPSVNALTKWLSHMATFRVSAMDGAMKTELAQRQSYRDAMVANGINSTVNQAILHPDAGDQILSNITNSAQALEKAGYGKHEIDSAITQGTNALRYGQVQGYLKQQQPELALALLQRDDVANQMNPKQFETAYNDTINVYQKKLKEQNENAQVANSFSLFKDNQLAKKDPYFQKVADDAFSQFVGNDLKASPTIPDNQIGPTASKIGTFFKTYNVGIGDKAKSTLEATLEASSDPNKVAAVAIGLRDLLKDPDQRGQSIFSQIGDKQRFLADRIGALIDGGNSPTDAVSLARNEASVTYSTPASKELINAYIRDNYSDLKVQSLIQGQLGHFYTLSPNAGFQQIADIKDAARTFVARFGDSPRVTTELNNYIANKYQVTDINGTKEVMEAAPEKFYQGDDLKEFQKAWSLSQNAILADKGKGVAPVLQPIPNLTSQQDKNQVSYYVYDANKNVPILRDDGQLQVFNYSYNDTIHGKLVAARIADMHARRDAINKATIAAMNNLDDFSKAAKVELNSNVMMQ